LFWDGITSDGTKIYAPAPQALEFQVGESIGTLAAQYPRETLHGLALGLVAAACFYLISDAVKQESTQKPSLKQDSAQKRSRR
jgi:hypothetical protein